MLQCCFCASRKNNTATSSLFIFEKLIHISNCENQAEIQKSSCYFELLEKSDFCFSSNGAIIRFCTGPLREKHTTYCAKETISMKNNRSENGNSARIKQNMTALTAMIARFCLHSNIIKIRAFLSSAALFRSSMADNTNDHALNRQKKTDPKKPNTSPSIPEKIYRFSRPKFSK